MIRTVGPEVHSVQVIEHHDATPERFAPPTAPRQHAGERDALWRGEVDERAGRLILNHSVDRLARAFRQLKPFLPNRSANVQAEFPRGPPQAVQLRVDLERDVERRETINRERIHLRHEQRAFAVSHHRPDDDKIPRQHRAG
jgi:hypothetical protein